MSSLVEVSRGIYEGHVCNTSGPTYTERAQFSIPIHTNIQGTVGIDHHKAKAMSSLVEVSRGICEGHVCSSPIQQCSGPMLQLRPSAHTSATVHIRQGLWCAYRARRKKTTKSACTGVVWRGRGRRKRGRNT